MALAINPEDNDSRALTQTRREGVIETTLVAKYVITGSDDPGNRDVMALGPQINDTWGDGSLGIVAISREYEVLRATGSSGAMRLIVKFGPPERLPVAQAEEAEYELSMMAETVKIEKSIPSQLHYPSGASGVGDLIGVNGDKIDGVDVYFPKGQYKETREINTLDSGYRKLLFQNAGTINASAWKGWAAGEVLFLGAVATRKGRGKWKMVYSFAIQANTPQSIETNYGGAPAIQSFTKIGWDYMWFERQQTANGAGTEIETKIEAVHIAKVYPTFNFALLGLGI